MSTVRAVRDSEVSAGTIAHCRRQGRVCQLSHGKLPVHHVTGEGSLFDVPPAAIGRYRVQHPLGAGTCGPVFRGESPEATPIAIKLLTISVRPERVSDVLDGLQKLVTDGTGVPGTVEPLDSGLHEGATPFLVTTLAPGDSLDVALRRFGPALLADVLPRLATLAAALDRLAAVGLHHGALHLRDIIVDALKSARGNMASAARALGTTQRIIGYKIKCFGIDSKRYAG